MLDWPPPSQDGPLRFTKQLQISVYLKSQPLTDAPKHATTRTLAKKVLGRFYAKPVGQNAIQLLTDESWKDIKARFRPAVRGKSSASLPVRIWNQGLLISYPLPDQRTHA